MAFSLFAREALSSTSGRISRFRLLQQQKWVSSPPKNSNSSRWTHSKLQSVEESAAHDVSQKSRLPRFLQSTIWINVLPKSIRHRLFKTTEDAVVTTSRQTSKQSTSWMVKFWRNPASPLIILPLLVGSQAIQLIALRSDVNDYNRRTDSKLETLKEVLRRINSGEWVVSGPDGGVDTVKGVPVGNGTLKREDAEKEIRRLLGTGQEEEELEWLGVINEAKKSTFPVKKERQLKNSLDSAQADRSELSPDETPTTVDSGKVSFY